MLREYAGQFSTRQDRVEAHPCVRASELRRVGVLVQREPDDDDFWAAVPYCEGVEAVFNSERDELSLYARGFPNAVVNVEWTACRFGGFRPLLICPDCRGRRMNLHRVGYRWACRVCHGLKYETQRLRHADRAYLRANRIRHRYNSKESGMLMQPQKPWYMHDSTFYADVLKLYEADLDSVRPVDPDLEEWFANYTAKVRACFPPRRASHSDATESPLSLGERAGSAT